MSENNRGGPWSKRRAAYAVFLNELIVCLRAARVRKRWVAPAGTVSVLLAIVCPTGMDHHNLIKPCLDAIQRAGVIENDRQVWDVRAVRVGSGKEGRIDFTVAALP